MSILWVRNIVLLLMISSVMHSCRVSYSFTGASIPPEMKTFNVENFRNQGNNCSPNTAFDFRDALQDKIQTQTSLKLSSDNPDATFTGTVVDCRVQQLSVKGDDVAAQTRYTVTVEVEYENEIKPDQNFKTEFSRYEDYDTDLNFSDIETELTEEIIEQLTEDVFNRAFVNW